MIISRRSLAKFMLFLLFCVLAATYVVAKWEETHDPPPGEATADSGESAVVTVLAPVPQSDAADAGTDDAPANAAVGDAPAADATVQSGAAGVSDSAAAATDDYFSQARLARAATNSRQQAALQTLLADPSAGQEVRDQAGTDLIALARRIALEGTAEALLQAKGFDPVLVVLTGEAATVVLGPRELTAAEAAQVGDIIFRCAGVRLKDIAIVCREK